jgi:alkylation response protein AidB-like acyl-CoA dehydrogenase
MNRTYAASAPAPAHPPADVPKVKRISKLVRDRLRPHVVAIDRDGRYPSDFLHEFGSEGGFLQPGALQGGLGDAVEATSIVGHACGSTAFLTWCQNASIWYLLATDNRDLREQRLGDLAAGRRLGATALSNAVKHIAGIEPLKLSGARVLGGYRVNGTLPWVSNVAQGHGFAALFRTDDGCTIGYFDCDWPGITLVRTAPFAALEGTSTFALRLKDVFMPDNALLAQKGESFVRRVQAGFILLQLGIGAGIVRGSLEDMRAADRSSSSTNRFLPDRPDGIENELTRIMVPAGRLGLLAADELPAQLQEILRLRLELADLALRAAQSALLHAGAVGFIASAAPQRRLREAMFFSILSPSTKHLRRVLSTFGAP